MTALIILWPDSFWSHWLP